MSRKISLPIYITAFILSLAIFGIGIYAGMIMDDSNLANIENRVEGLSQRTSSVQLLLLMEGEPKDYCPIFRSELSAIDGEVDRLGYELTFLEENKKAYDPALKKEYFMLEAGSFSLAKKVSEVCGDEVNTLLYFYSNENCPSCQEQGTEILRFRDRMLENGTVIRIYSFDGDLGSPVAEALMDKYNITGYPSIVANGKAYPGYADEEDMAALFDVGTGN
jgi:hypothetical protein